jgi:hypothetical protein
MRLLLITLLYFPSLFFGQTQLNGKVVDKKTKAAVPFATVGLIKENIGTNAVEQGSFILISQKQILNDSLIITCVGYETLKIPVETFKYGSAIELVERIVSLKPVTISAKQKWQSINLNKFSGCGINSLTTRGFQTQAAQHFSIPVENSILTEINVCAGVGIFYFKKSKFRIRIYDMDSITKAPSADLLDEVIEVTSSGKNERVSLEKYNIHIPHKDFFVAIEWLKIPINVEKTEGKMAGDTIYRPHLGITESEKNGGEAWSLYYNNTWHKNAFFDLKISVTIKY